MKSEARQYRKQDNQSVIAVQLDLDFEQLNYQKWGGAQRAKPGDWLVCNQGDTYSIDKAEFAKTYTQIAPGQYRKTATIWAWPAHADGVVKTLEGSTAYSAGDYLIAEEQGSEPIYAIAADSFQSLYCAID